MILRTLLKQLFFALLFLYLGNMINEAANIWWKIRQTSFSISKWNQPQQPVQIHQSKHYSDLGVL